jgi:hypothetical protein
MINSRDQYIKDPNTLLEYVKEILIVDLLDYVLALDEEKHILPLVDPPQGVYLKGSIKPLLDINKKYYFKSKYLNEEEGLIKTYKDVLQSKDDIVNEDGNIVLTLDFIRTRKKFLTIKPDINITAVDIAINLVLTYLNNLCPYTRYVSKPNLYYLIKPEYHNLIEDNVYEEAFDSLLTNVYNFVNNDIWFIYFHRVKGSTLIIEKTCDYRIYEWTKLMYESSKE